MDVPLVPGVAGQSTRATSDEDLLRRMAAGDEAPLDELYGRYRFQAFALARRILGSPEIAEEVVQDAFLSIWTRAASYNSGVGLVRPWLFSVVHHRAIDRVRRVRERRPTVPLDEAWTVPSRTDVFRDVYCGEQRNAIRLALALLPEEQRDAIDRAYFDDRSIAQISEITHAPVGTVKSRMRLGLARMRRLMDAEIAS